MSLIPSTFIDWNSSTEGMFLVLHLLFIQMLFFQVFSLSKFIWVFVLNTHSSILAWRILWTEEPGGLQSTGLQRGGHD